MGNSLNIINLSCLWFLYLLIAGIAQFCFCHCQVHPSSYVQCCTEQGGNHGWCTQSDSRPMVYTCTVGCVTQDQALADITQCRERGDQDRTCDHHTSYPVTQAHSYTPATQWQWYWGHLTPSLRVTSTSLYWHFVQWAFLWYRLCCGFQAVKEEPQSVDCVTKRPILAAIFYFIPIDPNNSPELVSQP